MMDRPPFGGFYGPPRLDTPLEAAGPRAVPFELAFVQNPIQVPVDGLPHATAVSLDPSTRALDFTFKQPALILQLQVIGESTGIDYASRCGAGTDQGVVVRVFPALDPSVLAIVTTPGGVGGSTSYEIAFRFDTVSERPRDGAPALIASETFVSNTLVTKQYTVPEGDNTLVFTNEQGSQPTISYTVQGTRSGTLYYGTPGLTSDAGNVVVAQITDPRDLVANGVSVTYSLGAGGTSQTIRIRARWLPQLFAPLPWQVPNLAEQIVSGGIAAGASLLIQAGAAGLHTRLFKMMFSVEAVAATFGTVECPPGTGRGDWNGAVARVYTYDWGGFDAGINADLIIKNTSANPSGPLNGNATVNQS